MSEVVGEAVVRIRTDDADVDRGAAAAGKKAGDKYGKGFTSGLKTIAGAAGLAFGTAAVVDFAKEGVKAATSVQDEIGALGVIIGESGTKKIEEFGESSANAFGISKVAALEAAHTFSTFGKAAGLSGNELADFSTEFVGLAGDLSSFNGGSTQDAIEAIGSALRGEAEPIRRYGVLLDDATLRASALRLGIIKTTKQALTPQQRVLAAQAEIWRQTKDAQGDASRTADSAANSQKRLTAQLEDLRLAAGEKLLPVITDGVQALSEFITEMENGTGPGGEFADLLQDLGDAAEAVFGFFNSLPGPVKKYGAELLIASVAIGKVNSLLGGMGPLLARNEQGALRAGAGLRSLGAGIRNAAGAGGLLLLQQSTKEANTQLSILEATAGGALSGAALGALAGPQGAAAGAALGGLAAGLYSLATAMNETDTETNEAQKGMQSYTATLQAGEDGVNKYTRALVAKNLQESGAIDAARALGISSKTAVNAALGMPKAQEKIAAATKKATDAWLAEGDQYDKNGKLIETANSRAAKAATDLAFKVGTQTDRLREARIESTEAALAQGNYNTVLAGVPKNVQTRIDQLGIETATDRIVALQRKYKLTPPQIETIMKAGGVPVTLRQIQAIIDKANKVPPKRTIDIQVNAQLSPEARRLWNASNGLLGPVIVPLTGVAGGKSQQGGSQRFSGGMTRVGEVGPERVILPTGSRVFTAAQTRQQDARMAASSSGGGVTYHVESLVIQNPVPEPASTSEQRVVANTAFLLGV